MSQLLIEPHYLGSIEYYALISNFDSVLIEINDRFQKQTYRNRCYLVGSNKVLSLTVPTSYSNRSLTKEVRIDHSQRWVKDHWGAIYSAYGKAPFFEYFADSFKESINTKHKFLIDLTVELMGLTFKLLSISVSMTYSESYIDNFDNDFRNVILPKKSFTDRKIYTPYAYSQLFSDTFIPNMSILDLIMCEGPQASEVLSASFLLRQKN